MPSETVEQLLRHFEARQHNLLPALRSLHGQLGELTPATLMAVAHYFNLSRADVQGVASFYTDLREPRAEHHVQICNAEACQALGSRRLIAHVEARHGTLGSVTGDGAVALCTTYCLGNCAVGPNVRIDDAVHARVDANRFDALVATLQLAGRAEDADR